MTYIPTTTDVQAIDDTASLPHHVPTAAVEQVKRKKTAVFPDAPPVWLPARISETYSGIPMFVPLGQSSNTSNDDRNQYVITSNGSYHIYTKEAFGILKKIYNQKYAIAESDFENYVIGPGPLLGWCPCASYKSKNQIAEYEMLELERKELKHAYEFLRAQFESEGPGAAVDRKYAKRLSPYYKKSLASLIAGSKGVEARASLILCNQQERPFENMAC